MLMILLLYQESADVFFNVEDFKTCILLRILFVNDMLDASNKACESDFQSVMFVHSLCCHIEAYKAVWYARTHFIKDPYCSVVKRFLL